MITGSIGITAANPTDVVKIRMQAQGQLPLMDRPYDNTVDCYRKTMQHDGVKGLWVGLGPNIMRNSVISAAEIASYDQFKQTALQNIGMKDGIKTHCSCAFLAGFVATMVGSPVDVLKTRIMNMNAGESAKLLVSDMIRNEGLRSFYKGFTANFMRIGSWNCCMFVTLEQIKGLLDDSQ